MIICDECIELNKDIMCQPAFTKYTCFNCKKTCMHANTHTPFICEECASTKNELLNYKVCQYCAKKIIQKIPIDADEFNWDE